MYKTSEIVAKYGINESLLNEYIIEQNIPVVNEEEISKKYFQTILSFIENTEDRIEKRLKKPKLLLNIIPIKIKYQYIKMMLFHS